MTVKQLKRHVDRRLRGKADKSGVHRLERRMDARFNRVEKRLDTITASLNARFNRLERLLNLKAGEHSRILDEHESRIRDLERAG